MLIFGKMSVGVRRMITGLSKRISKARTMNVYGRSKATRTIHMADLLETAYSAARDHYSALDGEFGGWANDCNMCFM
jgi:hypothetical protein